MAGRWLALAALAAALAALLLLLSAGPGTRLGWWGFRTGLGLLRYVFYGGGAALVFGVFGLLLGGARSVSLAAVLIGLGCAAVPAAMFRQSKAVPMIHDLTTDTQDPPLFQDLLAARAGAMNPPGYAGPEAGAEQQRAYPDLAPLVLDAPPARVFEQSEAAARDLGWEIVGRHPEQGRLEATDTTFWYGFKDDVVVRIRPQGAGSRVDVRSKSRVGRSDLGANAYRIRRFLSKLK